MITLAWFFQIIIGSFATYMRAHKEEPLVLLSFASGIYISAVTWFIALYHLPFEYFFLGFLSSYIWTIPWILIIFKRERYHE